MKITVRVNEAVVEALRAKHAHSPDWPPHITRNEIHRRLSERDIHRIVEHLSAGRMIEAVREVRAHTNASLSSATKWVDNYILPRRDLEHCRFVDSGAYMRLVRDWEHNQ